MVRKNTATGVITKSVAVFLINEANQLFDYVLISDKRLTNNQKTRIIPVAILIIRLDRRHECHLKTYF